MERMEQSGDGLQIIAILDAYLTAQENVPIALSQLWTDISCRRLSLSVSTDNASYDSDYSTIIKFIRGHPHLYKFENELVQMRSEIHRQCVSETLERVMQSNNWTVCKIGCCLGTECTSSAFKIATYGKGIESIRSFMNDHRRLFEQIKPFPLSSNDFMKQTVKLCDEKICLMPRVLLKNSTTNPSEIDSNPASSATVGKQSVINEQVSTSTISNTPSLINYQDFSSVFEIIDQHLEDKLQICKLWIRVNSLITARCSKQHIFEDMIWFITNHPHLYETNNRFVSKRSATHRMVLSELIESLKTQKVIYTKKEIFALVGRIAHEYRPSADECRERALESFFSDHELLFEKFSSDHPDPSKRKPGNTCLRIPNVYTIKERLETTDSSVTISASGIIQKMYPKYFLVLIESGQYAGQPVYCAFADILPISAEGSYQEGSKVSFNAFKRLHKPYSWQATSVTLQNEEKSEISEFTLANSKVNSIIISHPPSTVPGKPTVIKQNELSEEESRGQEASIVPSRATLLASEETRLRLLDSFLGDGCRTVNQIFQQFQELAVLLPNLFSSEQHLCEFIKNRSHLFLLDETSQEVSKTLVMFRSAMFDLLLLCQEGRSVEAIRLMIIAKTTASFAALVECGTTKETFVQFLQKYENIFELSELLQNDDRFVRARGFCDAHRELFLPRWYF